MKLYVVWLMVLIIAFCPVCSVFADDSQAIDIFHECGLIQGDGENLYPNRSMTYGEFAAVAARMYAGAEEYNSMMSSFSNWKEVTLYYSGFLFADHDEYEQIKDNFDKPITTEAAQNIMLDMLKPSFKNGKTIGYNYYTEKAKDNIITFDGLEAFGYRMSVIPGSEYITREEGCRMLCELMYLEFPLIGDYGTNISIVQYTLEGMINVRYITEEDDIDGVMEALTNRPKRKDDGQWSFPVDISAVMVREVKADMEKKGWKNIEVTEGFLDEKIGEQTGLVLERTDEEKKMHIISVSGQIEGKYGNPLFAVVELVYDDEMSQGEIYQIFYVSSSGRIMTPEYNDISDDPNSLLNADDQELWYYMYSY